MENLIHDYEKLKETYRTEETFENYYSSEADVGQNSKDNQLSRSRGKTSKTPGNYATQMFVFESEKESNEDKDITREVNVINEDTVKEDLEDNIKEVTPKPIKEKTKKKKTKKKPKYKPEKIKTHHKSEPFKEKSKTIQSTTPKSKTTTKETIPKHELKIKPHKEKPNEIKREPKIEYFKDEVQENAVRSENETDSYYYSSSSEGNYIEDSNTALRLENPKAIEETPKAIEENPITYTIKRYELDNNQPNGEIKRIRDHSIKVTLINGSKPVWKIVRTEDFTNNNIWTDIVQNKPVNLKKVSEKAYYRYRVASDSKQDPRFRRNYNVSRRNEKVLTTAGIIITKPCDFCVFFVINNLVPFHSNKPFLSLIKKSFRNTDKD